MATCSFDKKTGKRKDPAAMCRRKEERQKSTLEGSPHSSQASTSHNPVIPVQWRVGNEAGSGDLGRLPEAPCSLPSSVSMPDGEEMYLSRRLKFDSRSSEHRDSPTDRNLQRGRPIPDSFHNNPERGTSPTTDTHRVVTPGSSAPESRGGRGTGKAGPPPASDKPPPFQPPPWPWPYEYGTCINPPPNRTVLQISGSPPDRPRASSLSTLPQDFETERRRKGRSGRLLASAAILTRKTVTTPGNFAGK